MPGTFDRSRGVALTREVSPDYSKAVSKFFGTKSPDYSRAIDAQSAYFAALRAHGSEVITLPALDGFPDCSFTEDTAVIIDDMAIIANLGHQSRDGEQESVAEFLSDDFEIVRMPEGANLDGGAVVFFDDCFLIGISSRTNKEGADFLYTQAKSVGIDAKFLEVPSSTLHLTTVCSSPRPGTIVAAEGHLEPDSVSFAEEVIWVPNKEDYAANTIAYGDRVIIADGYPEARRLMLDAGFSITSLEMSEFREVDASLTCLSVFIG